MEPWLILTIGAALAGGLLVLHGFAQCKETSEVMLNVYHEMLANSKPPPKAEKSPED